MKNLSEDQLTLDGKYLNREDAVRLTYEYYKHRILLQNDDALVEGFVLYGHPLSDWSNQELQELLNGIESELPEIKTWPRTHLHTELEKILGHSKTKDE